MKQRDHLGTKVCGWNVRIWGHVGFYSSVFLSLWMAFEESGIAYMPFYPQNVLVRILARGADSSQSEWVIQLNFCCQFTQHRTQNTGQLAEHHSFVYFGNRSYYFWNNNNKIIVTNTFLGEGCIFSDCDPISRHTQQQQQRHKHKSIIFTKVKMHQNAWRWKRMNASSVHLCYQVEMRAKKRKIIIIPLYNYCYFIFISKCIRNNCK